MDDGWLPKCVIFGKIEVGSRKVEKELATCVNETSGLSRSNKTGNIQPEKLRDGHKWPAWGGGGLCPSEGR